MAAPIEVTFVENDKEKFTIFLENGEDRGLKCINKFVYSLNNLQDCRHEQPERK